MNYVCFGGGWWLRYAYVDSHEYLADSLFARKNIRVRYGSEYRKDGEAYRIIFCKIRKKYKEDFEKALVELKNKMLIFGNTDYETFCEETMRWMLKEE